MKAFVFIAAAAAAVVAAAPASAQNFSGPRIEGRIGWDGTSVNLRDTRDFNGRGRFGPSSYSSDYVIGAEAGFDANLGSIVVGGYAGIDITEAEEEFQRELVTFETGRNITAGARVGYAFSENALGYVKAGYSNGRLSPTFQPGANQAPFTNFSRNRDGYHYGAGVEVPVRQGFYIRADYTHTTYDDFAAGGTTELRFKRDQITGGIGLRF